MAPDKDVRQNRIVRLLRLGALVRQQSGTLRAEAVCERLKISRRTFYRDVRLLRDAGVSIRYSANTGAYNAEVFASVFGETLTVEEAAALLATVMGAQPRPETRFSRVLTDLQQKIDNILREQFADSHSSIQTAAESFYREQSTPLISPKRKIDTSHVRNR